MTAQMNQEKKAAIAAELKRIMPQGWKYSLSMHHHTTLILTLWSAPVDLIRECLYAAEDKSEGYIDLNRYHLERAFRGPLLKIFQAIDLAMNIGNYNHVKEFSSPAGHYTRIRIGRWDKPFRYIPEQGE